MDWGDLEVFLAAVRTGSYTAAGRGLAVNRTTIGRRIEALERSLGLALFEDSPLGFAPTREGTRVLAAAQAIEHEVKAMMADLGASGRHPAPVRLAVSGGLGCEFLAELAQFSQANGDIPVQLLADLDPLDAVTQRRADLGLALVRSLPLRLAGVHVATLSQATYRRRGTAGGAPLGWGYAFAATLPGPPWSPANPAGDPAEEAGLFTCNDWPQMIGAVRAGIGMARLWCFAADADPTLERIDSPNPRHDSPLWLVHRSKAPPSPALTRLMAFLAEALPRRFDGTDSAPGTGGPIRP